MIEFEIKSSKRIIILPQSNRGHDLHLNIVSLPDAADVVGNIRSLSISFAGKTYECRWLKSERFRHLHIGSRPSHETEIQILTEWPRDSLHNSLKDFNGAIILLGCLGSEFLNLEGLPGLKYFQPINCGNLQYIKVNDLKKIEIQGSGNISPRLIIDGKLTSLCIRNSELSSLTAQKTQTFAITRCENLSELNICPNKYTTILGNIDLEWSNYSFKSPDHINLPKTSSKGSILGGHKLGWSPDILHLTCDPGAYICLLNSENLRTLMFMEVQYQKIIFGNLLRNYSAAYWFRPLLNLAFEHRNQSEWYLKMMYDTFLSCIPTRLFQESRDWSTCTTTCAGATPIWNSQNSGSNTDQIQSLFSFMRRYEWLLNQNQHKCCLSSATAFLDPVFNNLNDNKLQMIIEDCSVMHKDMPKEYDGTNVDYVLAIFIKWQKEERYLNTNNVILTFKSSWIKFIKYCAKYHHEKLPQIIAHTWALHGNLLPPWISFGLLSEQSESPLFEISDILYQKEVYDLRITPIKSILELLKYTWIPGVLKEYLQICLLNGSAPETKILEGTWVVMRDRKNLLAKDSESKPKPIWEELKIIFKETLVYFRRRLRLYM
jgi:hypothetical protein